MSEQILAKLCCTVKCYGDAFGLICFEFNFVLSFFYFEK